MDCKYYGSKKIVKNGKANGTQVYKCKECGHRFFLNDNFSKMQSNKRIIAAALNFYYDGLSLRKAQRNLEQIFGEHISQVTILNWIRKYSQLVKDYVNKQAPQLSGLWHEDETMLGCEGRNIWFWEMIDEDTKFMVASHISETRTFEDTVTIFEKGFQQSKERPKAVFVDGCNAYKAAFNRVFYSRYKVEKVELVQRVGIRARETNNSVERLDGTLKDRTRCMRGLHSYESTKLLLEGWSVYYNCVRPHQSLGNKTPAQVAGMNVPNTWMGLIEEATKQETISNTPRTAESIENEVTKRGVDPFIDTIQVGVNMQ